MVYNMVLKVLCSETVASRLQGCLNFFVVRLFLGLRHTKEDTSIIHIFIATISSVPIVKAILCQRSSVRLWRDPTHENIGNKVSED